MLIVDAHPHIYAADRRRYPTTDDPWEPGEPATAEDLRRRMAECGVARAVFIQTSTFYGVDNRYVCDSALANQEWATGVVNLDTGSVTTWDYLPDAMPMRGGSSWMATMKLAKEDPRIIEALARRGITDVDKVVMEPWPTGPTAKTFENAPFDYSETDPVWKDELGKYTAYIHMWLREDSDLDNYYAHPIDGLKAVVDIGGMEILSVEDTDDSIPVPMELNNYAKQYLPEENPKVPPKPIEILQPDGATFTVDEGNKLEWMGWDLTIGFNAREGLTLHSIGFTEPGTTERRSICYRASVAEMVVPYGSPNRGLWRKSVFDTGEAWLRASVRDHAPPEEA